MKYSLNTILILLLLSVYACDDPDDVSFEEETREIDWQTAADSSSNALVDNFWNSSDKYFNYGNTGNTDFHYWPQAHALDVLIDAYLRTGDSFYKGYIDQWYEGVPVKNGGNFINDFYDDMEWNGLAMLRAYEVTGDNKFKEGTDQVWEDIKMGWNETAGGGIAWQKNMLQYKNTPANAPASILASRLYNQFGNEADKEWALKIYDWLKSNLFDAGTGFVYDGMNRNSDMAKDNWEFTYNQGVFIGAALELYNITNEAVYLNDAIKAADYALNVHTNSTDRVLKDEGSGDGGLFKGIFIRYFTQLILHPDLAEGTKKRYVNFLYHNAETLWLDGTNRNGVLFGTYWATQPGSSVDLTVETSGAMLIEAAALLEDEGLNVD
ncbi:glycoside hydrolase family 76 protein [Chondrinema litorale]|uniref:glycoside hydrolase family 76 protein n=1 Tax=Chondrinema litorale TaxID=2994555 RepID=UPI002543B64C|nr:glycoside hydrolase family 76 protein [Chondrinema litorale]UZR97551.1 hypothetical protein OQ292_26370 [Chondrinema litorale]